MGSCPDTNIDPHRVPGKFYQSEVSAFFGKKENGNDFFKVIEHSRGHSLRAKFLM